MASVTAAGRPRVTSAAKLGPERMPGCTPRALAAITSVMNWRVPRSMPLAQATTGAPAASDAAIARTAARMCCEGTATRIASCWVRSASSGSMALVDAHLRQARTLAPAAQQVGAGAVACA